MKMCQIDLDRCIIFLIFLIFQVSKYLDTLRSSPLGVRVRMRGDAPCWTQTKTNHRNLFENELSV